MDSYFLSSPEVKQIWQQALGDLQLRLSGANYNTWVVSNPLIKIELVDNDKATCTILSPTAFHSMSIKKNLQGEIKTVLDEIIGRNCEIAYEIGTPVGIKNYEVRSKKEESKIEDGRLKIDNNPQSSIHNLQSPRVEDLFSPTNIQSNLVDRALLSAKNAGLRNDYTFETFAVSTNNEMAHAAATAVSQRPGEAYNPLFLFGGVGVGKTHLMHAIGNNIIQASPGIKIIYCTGEEFTNEIVRAIQNKKALGFKEKYRQAGILLIDDVQFIAGKNAVQEEFFHTFNALTQTNSQIVMTSDRPPHEINLLEDRLRSRFEAGLMVDIGQPSFELRTAILLIKSRANNIDIPMNLAQMIASRVDSARKIEGIIKKLKSALELQHKELTEGLIDEILYLEAEDRKQVLKVSPSDVIKAVANHYHVKQLSLRGESRVKSLVGARHIAMYLLKEDLEMALTEIGKWFGNRDHTSVLHAVRKIEKELMINQLTQRDVSALRMSLKAISS